MVKGMKKKSPKDNKIHFSKSRNKKKRETPNEYPIEALNNSIENDILSVNSNTRLQDDMNTTPKCEDSFTVVNKMQNLNSSSMNKLYSTGSNNYLDLGKMNASEFYNFHCIYCNINFPNKMKLQAHCLTDEHQSVIISDEGRDWKYRPPPRGVMSNEYALCQNFTEKNICRFGDQCIQAHSKEELSEWKERFEYRSMKLEKAKERELHGASYADRLLEKLNNSQNIERLLSDKIDGVTFSVSSDVNLSISQKPSNHAWVITLHCPYRINAVALLYDSHRNHFSLTNITMINSQKHIHKSFKLKDTQEWINHEVEHIDNVNMEYKIEVYFETEIYGTFRQAVVVDFGIEPVFIQRFCVDIVPLDEFKELESARTTVITETERWCPENTNILMFEPLEKTENDIFNDRLQEMYPAPTNKNITLNQTSLEKHPTKNNYRSRMHDLLNYEEMAQFDLISHFNIKSYLHLSKSYLIVPSSGSVAKYAFDGELYAKLDLSSEVSEDSPQGRLILNNCNSVLVSKPDIDVSRGIHRERRAYEALLEDKTKKEIYIRLSKQTVSELRLQPEMEAPLDIQFQLNRLPFCEMHYAINHLSTFDFLFPNTLIEPSIPWSPSMQWNESSDMKLNLKQKEALVAITANLSLKLPPILIIGPFGTGKTFTMSQAILQIVQQPDTRILICTHSNSAADIYIKDYLHPHYESGALKTKPLRIYYHRRKEATVHTDIHDYCLFENKNGEKVFSLPTKAQILKHRIIVTTINTSISIAELGMPRGYFSHILIDEAAQVMECSTLIPLSLATSSTRIVLAGDYMQLSTEVFSPVCKERNLQTSLLERLYDLYPTDYPCKIMLVENYRSHPAIIKFTSKFFYEGRLKARGKISAHPRYYPLTFFTARGEDVQDSNSTAYYNNSEVLEVCERVMEICKSWPVKLWGPLNEESIGVLSPYLDQVRRIRAELRKKRLYKVSVERVLNVQGKEFRVVILSTVRTRHTCSGNDSSLDFGFLSNAKLLTTAITRAQSLVAVVGDPVSLCSLGKCRKLWEEFLRQCSEAGSLHGITWSNLRSQLDGIELRKIYGLNPLAQEFIPRYLLLSAVPPVALFPQAPPMQCFPYNRSFPYSPNVFPQNLPATYQSSTAFLTPISQQVAVCAPKTTNDAHGQKVNIVNPYSGLQFQPFSNVCNNRAAAIIPFGTAPAPTLGPFPTVASPNYFSSSNSNHSVNPTFIQPPPVGVYMAGPLPYQSKVNVLPQVVSARPPPGFNGNLSSLLDQERLKGESPSVQNIVASTAYPVPKPFQDTRSSSPDKSIQFLNNVHFPREPSLTPSWSDNPSIHSKSDPGLDNIMTTRNSLENSQSNAEPFMGEKFAEEISKLLNDQSPTRSTVHSSVYDPTDYAHSHLKSNINHQSFRGLEQNQPYYQTHQTHNSEPNINNHLSSNSATYYREPITSKSFLTLQQVEKSMYSNVENNKSKQLVETTSASRLTNSFVNHNSFQEQAIHKLVPDIFQDKALSFLDNPHWSGSGSLTSQFPLTGLLRSSSGTSSNIPLYLRKGSASMSSNLNSHAKAEKYSDSLGSSSGWDIETVKNGVSHSYESVSKDSFDLSSRLLRAEPRERENSLLVKYSEQNESSKTYAGVLRSKKFEIDGEQI